MMRRFASPLAGTALAAAAVLALGPSVEAQPPRPSGSPGVGATYGGRLPGGFFPGGQIGNYLPGRQIGGFYPGGQIGGYIQGGQYGGYYPGGQPGNYYRGGQYGGYYPGYGYPGASGPVYPVQGNYTGPQHAGPSQYAVPQQYGAPPAYYAQPSVTAPAAGAAQPHHQPADGTARLTVRLPANAQLWVEDFLSRQTGPVRVLTTPALEPGKTYHYTLKAQWDEGGRQVTQERAVDFQAGASAEVDFTQPAPQAAPQAPPQLPRQPATPPDATPPPG